MRRDHAAGHAVQPARDWRRPARVRGRRAGPAGRASAGRAGLPRTLTSDPRTSTPWRAVPDTDLQTASDAPSGVRTRTGGGHRLVIVESPAKAKKIASFLGAGYTVESSIGHIRDLPRNASDVPASHKGQAGPRLGVNVDNDLEPLYVARGEKKPRAANPKSLLKDGD